MDARVSHVGLGFDSITPGFIGGLHAAGLSVFVYTVNDPRDIGMARVAEVGGIISDYPERVTA